MAAGARRMRLPERLESPAVGFAVACLLAAAAVCSLVGTTVLFHPGGSAVGRNPSSDYQIMTWSLAWWPWAVRHAVNPLHTHLLWAPGGFSTLWMTTIPAASLIALPLTLTAGPLVAFNVVMIVAVVLATGAGYLLCRELTGQLGPSLLGGLVFGLSPYMLGHALSQHLNLVLVFPIPLLALLVVRYVRGRTSARRAVAGLALLLLLLLGSSLELFVDFTLLAAFVFVVAIVAGGTERRTFLRAGALVTTAYAVCLPVLVPLGVVALSAAHAPLRSSPTDYAADVLNIVIPTSTLLLGNIHGARNVSQHFVGNIGERDAYLGIPLLVVSVAAVRAGWRRGAWIAGAAMLAALLLSLGPSLTIGGRPVVRIPFAVGGLPVLRNALPVRLSVFTALAAACLCAIWFARPHRRGLRTVAAALILGSLLPNFWVPARLPGAWAVTSAFGWSTPHISRGFVTRGWRTVIRRGANVLVLPTGDRTAASYWQATAGMSFTLAFPATPFVPPRLAADPTVARVADDVLPQLDGAALGGARLRALLVARHVDAVVVAPPGRRRWSRLVGVATGTRPVSLHGLLAYGVPQGLAPLAAAGALARGRSRGHDSISAWVRFDGRCGHVRARLRGRAGATGAPVTLSSADGDAEATAAAVNAYGRAAVVFTEWRAHELLLRVATYSRSGWNVATLEQRTQPIWSPRVVVTPNGTTVAMWIDQVDPLRSVRVAVLPANGTWHRPLTLDSADGLGSIGAAAGREDLAAVAWHDSVANEERVRTTVYAHGSWSRVVTLAAGVERLDHVAVGPDAAFIRWRARRFPKQKVEVFQAVRRGSAWAGAEALLRWREQKPRSARAATRAGERMQVLRLPLRLPRRMIELPILMYHRVAPLTRSLPAITRALTVTPQDFAAQMRWLVSHGYHAVTQRQTFDALEHSAPLPTKPIMITFDDGYRDVLSNAAPVLARLHMPATAYVISGRISSSDPSFLTWDDLRALERAGISIGSHTVHHLELPLLPAATAYAELVKSRDTLQQHLGHPVQWFAYPSGRTNSASERLVAEAGYVLAVTTHQGALQRADAPFALRRYRILGTTGVTGLAALLRH